ncbi:hypothetical protein [Citrobacter werkmanii]|uniref:hypothetical protein n=1 Tax=Citrobacter werkmanii TaxID=67827 RepID=UPI00254E609F|nr:hypothetical protein [Citrobacter werkmanii]
MGRNNKRKAPQSNPSKKKPKDKNEPKPFLKKFSSFILWLSATGGLTFAVTYVFDFLTGDVEVRYVKSSGRSYEFNLTNKSSTDQVIETFRIVPDFEQKVIYKITKDITGVFTKDGVSIPGGNISSMPAYEYKEMNGYVLAAKSDVNFFVPPLVARNYVEPEYVVVFAEYRTKSNNKYMAKLESALINLKLRDGVKRQKYLIVNNFWTPISNSNFIDAVKIACRDDDVFAKTEECKKYINN